MIQPINPYHLAHESHNNLIFFVFSHLIAKNFVFLQVHSAKSARHIAQ